MDAHVRLRNLIWSLACALRVNIWFLLGMHKGKVHINETLILIGDGAIKVHSTTLVCSCFREKISNFILPRSPLIRHHQRSDSTWCDLFILLYCIDICLKDVHSILISLRHLTPNDVQKVVLYCYWRHTTDRRIAYRNSRNKMALMSDERLISFRAPVY